MINIKYDSEVIYPYTYDSSNLRGSADLLLIPKSIDELSESLKYCFDNNIKVTISGAGTGITGARVPFGGAIISTERYKHIEISEDLNFVKCGSAVTLKELEDYLEQFNRFLPPNPTEYNASIGGNTATNASGARTFKYGAIRQYINSLTIVLMNGDILYLTRGQNFVNDNNATIISTNGNNYNFNIPNYQMPNIKNASGYYVRENMDVIDLFIGSEGTLGVFYEIVLKVLPRPEYILGGVIYFDDSNKLYEFVSNLRNLSRRDNSIINSRLIEYFDRKSLDLLKPKYNEIPDLAVGAIWFEQEYSNENEEILLESWYEFISNFTTLIDNTWFAMNSKEHERLKEFRHELPLQVYENLTNNSQKKVGLDTAVPDDKFNILFQHYLNKCPALSLEYVVFGHIGNSHLHANIFCKNDEEYTKAKIFYDETIELSLSLGGTVSAEHGIGKLKTDYLVKMYGDKSVESMRNLKRVLDSKYLLNVNTMFLEN